MITVNGRMVDPSSLCVKASPEVARAYMEAYVSQEITLGDVFSCFMISVASGAVIAEVGFPKLAAIVGVTLASSAWTYIHYRRRSRLAKAEVALAKSAGVV